MNDQPFHHTPDHYSWLTQHSTSQHPGQHAIWGHDHDGAYRQLPLAEPSVAYALLITPDGPTLWHHHVLLFGSAASVWAYNRFGDVLTTLSRTLTATPVLHYVDDYGAIEPTHLANSSFTAFEDLNGTLGFHMKQSKRQPPLDRHKIQGVYIHHFADHTEIQPCPARITRIIADLQTAISARSLSPDLARKLAGKCSFTATQLFGRVGRFAIRTLYDQAFSRHDSLPNHAIPGLQPLTNILQHSYPRHVPHHPTPVETAIIYTDAFYKPGEVPIRSADLIPEQSIELTKSASNGWAAVLFSPHGYRTTVLFGHVPHNLLLQFAHNNTFIYFLEAWAAIIAPVLFQPLLTPQYAQLCDNEAAKMAIIKGTGKHQPMNNLLGSHWAWHNRHQITPHMFRVPSKANIADPFSRMDFDISTQLGWRVLEPPHRAILKRTFQILGNTSFAHETGFENVQDIKTFHEVLLSPSSAL